MSCHVMSCRHCCINSKKYLSKTFSFHKIIYKYFAGFFACYLDCHASLHQRWADARSARNDEKNIVITREWNDRSNPKYMLCFFDNNVASAHCVNNSKRSTQGVRHRRPVGKTPCYKKLDCFTRQRWTLVPFAMTGKIKIAHAVRHMAMTITKIFNSISFRDYSLLFIKKIY